MKKQKHIGGPNLTTKILISKKGFHGGLKSKLISHAPSKQIALADVTRSLDEDILLNQRSSHANYSLNTLVVCIFVFSGVYWVKQMRQPS